MAAAKRGATTAVGRGCIRIPRVARVAMISRSVADATISQVLGRELQRLPALPHDVEDRLPAEYQRHNSQRLQRLNAKP